MIFGNSNPPPPRPNTDIPEAKANLFSVLIAWWANDFISLGYKRHLEKDDLYVLNNARLAKTVTDKFEVEWKKETQKNCDRKESIFIKSSIHGFETGFLSRTILITAIHRKVLVLSGKARNLFSNGKIINLMSTDTSRIDFACTYFHIIWAAPIQCCMALGLFYKTRHSPNRTVRIEIY
ncbi:18855_t:CDS:2 [Racocetra persica]|uniref:18855_t:CDS:1 n=1 Tax=Racocetra persica TaxID=160502 RepID=A0ACA9QS14_9GLOM|nr:18855_t:CDS:2 [Racocetra persica]